MIGTLRSLLVLTLVGAVAALAPPAATAGQTQTYVVVLEPGSSSTGAEATSLARQYGGRVGFVYEHALRGFSITASSAAAAALARNPRVSYVEADQPVTVDAQSTPTGIGRIFAAKSGTTVSSPASGYNANLDIDGVDDWRVDVDVAVIDTGIDLDNPDLNVAGGISCLNVSSVSACGGSGNDDHYHGTHVAGTIAALDNGVGVVGVAPGARLWAVKVLDSTGSGSDAGVIAGIDWMLKHNASTADGAGDIEVANMSLGGSKSNAENDAVNNAVAQGVTMVVAAGNSSANASNYSPASAASAITVSALADYDGLPGGMYGGAKCYSDVDDTFANFSNYGSVVDMIAPGVCITSTNNNSTTLRTISGTSMASPHVAGAAALLRSMGNSVAATESLLKSTGNGGWSGDRDTVHEPLLDVHDPAVFAPRLVAGSAVGGPTNQAPAAAFTPTCTDLSCSFDASASSDSDGTIASYSWNFGDGATSTNAAPSHTYAAGGAYTVTLTVTDNGGLTDTTSQSFTVTAPPSGLTFTGSWTSQKSSWTARVNVAGAAPGSVVSGTWAVGSSTALGSCTASTTGTCTISYRKISNTITSVTWTYDGSPAAPVTISKP